MSSYLKMAFHVARGRKIVFTYKFELLTDVGFDELDFLKLVAVSQDRYANTPQYFPRTATPVCIRVYFNAGRSRA